MLKRKAFRWIDTTYFFNLIISANLAIFFLAAVCRKPPLCMFVRRIAALMRPHLNVIVYSCW